MHARFNDVTVYYVCAHKTFKNRAVMVGLPSSFCLLLLLTGVCVSTGPENDGDVYQMPLPMPARGVNPPKVRSRPIVRTTFLRYV